MRSFQEKLKEFEARGVRVVTISVDPPDVNKKHFAKQGFTMPVLSDEKLAMLERYDLVHSGGFRGNNIAKPGEFLLAADGAILWRNLTENYRVRAKPDDILKVVDELKAKN